MGMKTTALLLSCLGTLIGALEYLEPEKMCINYVDCGDDDVTPSLQSDNQRYRMMPSTENSTSLYIGGRREFIKIDSSCNESGEDPWITTSIKIKSCQGDVDAAAIGCSGLVSTNPTLKCDNYIRVIEELEELDELLVCGTRDSFSRCYIFQNNCNLEPRGGSTVTFEGETCSAEQSYDATTFSSVADFTSRNFDVNNTFAVFETELFVGSSPDISVTPKTYIGKLDFNFDMDDPFSNFVETFEIEGRSVNEAHFVGRPYRYSMNESDFWYVLFFYRETAVEHINQGKVIYSRVGRACLNDTGHGGKWQSYIKARLNCSTPGDFADYFNEIQDYFVTKESPEEETEEEETYFYAIFNKPPSGPHQSALCVYKLSDIHKVFETSDYRGTADVNSLWLANQNDQPDPERRPGCNCSNLSPDDATFLSKELLMDDLVENYNYKTQLADASDEPLFIANGVRFSRIIVDNRNNTKYMLRDVVIFIGTDAGEVWKVTDPDGPDIPDSSNEFNSIVYWRSDDGSPITGLGLVTSNDMYYLYATTHNKIIKIDLQYGKAQSMEQFNQIYPPYLPQSTVPPVSGVICSNSFEQTFCNGNDVLLTCPGCFDPDLVNDKVTATDTQWMFTPDNGPNAGDEVNIEKSGLGHFITFNKISSGGSNPLSYLLIRTHERTSGSYRCVVTQGSSLPTELDSKTNKVMVRNCTTDMYKMRQATRSQNAEDDAIANRDMYNQRHEGEVKIEWATCDGSADCFP